MKKLSPFDFVNAISYTKEPLMDDPEVYEKDYVPYIVNRSLSYHLDSILYANDMNMFHRLDKPLQFSYLLHSLRARKRFSRWSKPDSDESLKLVQKEFGCNVRRAAEILNILSESDIAQLKQQQEDASGVSGHGDKRL